MSCRASAVSLRHPGASSVPAGRLHLTWVWKPHGGADQGTSRQQWVKAGTQGFAGLSPEWRYHMNPAEDYHCLVLGCAVRSLGWCSKGYFCLVLGFVG